MSDSKVFMFPDAPCQATNGTDPDGYDGLVFNRWYADMCRQGIPIDWHEFI